MSKEISVRLVENFSIDVVPYKTKDMHLRELCDRIYYLLQRCTSPSGRTMVQILGEVNDMHHQQLFEIIYRHVRKRYLNSLQKHSARTETSHYLLEKNSELFLAKFDYLRDILALFKIQESQREIPHYLRKHISRKMLTALYDDIPRLRILYIHRHNPSPYRSNVIETVEVLHRHYDGEPIPPFIRHVFIHKIFKFQGHYIKIWELVPDEVRHPTPVCLLPGFGSNYYTFHFEGNNSLDYHLVKNGSRVFVLDHEWEEQDANIDIYTEYLLTTTIDFIKRRTTLPQVILAGHGLGGTLTVFKGVMDALQRPQFITSVKALILLNAPLNFNANYFVPPWLAKAGEMVVDVLGKRGAVPIGKLFRAASYLPGVSRLLTKESGVGKSLPQILGWERHELFAWWDTHFRLNPFTTSPQVLKTLMRRALTNPPRLVFKHLISMMQSETDGAVSYNFEELHFANGEALPDLEKDWEQSDEDSIKTIGINYTGNLHRIPAAIALLAVQTIDDVLAPPNAFFRLWNRWPQHHKLRLESYPEDFQNQEQNCQKVTNFLQKYRLSTAIGVTIHQGRHMDCLSNQKRLVSTFIAEVDKIEFSPIEIVKTEIRTHRHVIEVLPELMQKIVLERDLAKKIRFLDTHFFWAEQGEMLRVLLDLIVTRKSLYPPEKRYADFMTRDTKTIEENEDLKYDVLHCCVNAIISFSPDPERIVTQILQILTESREAVSAESFRALIDLSVALYGYSVSALKTPPPAFLKKFEKLLYFSVQHPERHVSLHAVRAFFYTRDPYFIQKGFQIYQGLPPELQAKTQYIFWNELHKLLSETAYQPGQTQLAAMSAFIDLYDQLGTPPPLPEAPTVGLLPETTVAPKTTK